MKTVLVILAIVLVCVGLLLLGVFLAKKGVLKDDNDNNLPDFVDEAAKRTNKKINDILDEAEERIEAVIAESKDVAKAVKEVGNQIGDIPKAATGKKRVGRKPKK